MNATTMSKPPDPNVPVLGPVPELYCNELVDVILVTVAAVVQVAPLQESKPPDAVPVPVRGMTWNVLSVG
jgi:hypothetical protein